MAMTDHLITYTGVANVSLGLITRDYGPEFVRFANVRGDIDGTRIRPPYYVATHFEPWLERLEKEKGKNEAFAILVHDDSRPERSYRYIGHMGIHDIQWPQGTGVTGSVIGDRNSQGKGYGKEAKLLIQKHAFDTLHLHKLKSEVKSFNAASLGHLLACGYRICGRLHEEELHEGRRVDLILLECFRRDWEVIWEAYRTTKTPPRLTDEQHALVKKETNQKD